MLRLGKRYGHLAGSNGCSCCDPALRQATRRLDAFSRRHFLAGAVAAVAGLASGAASAQAPRRILFRGARVFDGRSGTGLARAQVLVEGNRIAAVDAAMNPAPDGAQIIDCDGRVLMPGLIDAHWHAIYAAVPLNVLLAGDPGIIFASATAEAGRTLLRGFTTVRDMGGPVFSFRQAIDSGIIAGPRIFPSGAMITTSGGHGDLRMPSEIPRDGDRLSLSERMGAAAIADDAGRLQQRIREQLLQGASQVKVLGGGGVSSPRSPLDTSTFSEDELRAAVAVARDWNTYVAVHAYAPKTVQRALRAGATCIEHGHLMDEATARAIAEKGVWLSMQPFLTPADTGALSGPAAERAERLFAGTPKVYDFIRRFGIKAAWGSDLLFSAELAPRQSVMLTHLANWYSNAEALRIATSVNAELLALSGLRSPYDGRLGVIEAGALADILVVNGDPVADIRLLEDPAQNLAIIMKDGRVHKNTLP